jgi:hypothetical protein
MNIDFEARFHLIRIALDHEKDAAMEIKFRLDEYMVMPFSLTLSSATYPLEVIGILRHFLEMEVVIWFNVYID